MMSKIDKDLDYMQMIIEGKKVCPKHNEELGGYPWGGEARVCVACFKETAHGKEWYGKYAKRNE